MQRKGAVSEHIVDNIDVVNTDTVKCINQFIWGSFFI